MNASIFGANPGTGTTDWSAYLAGRCMIAGTIYTPSDQDLKYNIDVIASPGERLMLLRPSSYLFNTVQYPTMGLPSGQQFGFIAQELAEVFPDMVVDAIHPAVLDSSGAEISPAIPFKAVSTGGLTPVIVAAFQEEHVIVAALSEGQNAQAQELETLRTIVQVQQERLDHMEEMLAACCARGDADGFRGAPTANVDLPADLDADRKLRILPNPFSEPPTVYYTLDRGGRLQLIANSADGKELSVLQEATLEKGSYQLAWDTSALAPGMYYVRLLMDGQLIVKKTVKVTH